MFIKETADFLNKLKDLHELLKEAILVAADVVELYSKKPNAEDLQVLCKQYDKFLYKMATHRRYDKNDGLCNKKTFI